MVIFLKAYYLRSVWYKTWALWKKKVIKVTYHFFLINFLFLFPDLVFNWRRYTTRLLWSFAVFFSSFNPLMLPSLKACGRLVSEGGRCGPVGRLWGNDLGCSLMLSTTKRGIAWYPIRCCETCLSSIRLILLNEISSKVVAIVCPPWETCHGFLSYTV